MLLLTLTLCLSAAPSDAAAFGATPSDAAASSAAPTDAPAPSAAALRPGGTRLSLFAEQPGGTIARMTGAAILAPAVTLGTAWLVATVPLQAAWAAVSAARPPNSSSSGLLEGFLIGLPTAGLVGLGLLVAGTALFTLSLAVVSALGTPDFLRTFKKAVLPPAGAALVVAVVGWVVAQILMPVVTPLLFGGVMLGVSAVAGAAVPLIVALMPDAPERRGVTVARF